MQTYQQFQTEYAQRQKSQGKSFDKAELSRLWQEHKSCAPSVKSQHSKSTNKEPSLLHQLADLRTRKKAGENVKEALRNVLALLEKRRMAKRAQVN